MRDDFSAAVIEVLFKRAGARCSVCDQVTSGPHALAQKAVRIGVAAHICAASLGGPRYASEQSPDERGAAENGIWLCANHGVLIDRDSDTYTVEKLRELKAAHEARVKNELLGSASASEQNSVAELPVVVEYTDLLTAAQDRDVPAGRLFAEALALSIRTGDRELRAFCETELTGYGEGDAPALLPWYRRPELFVSFTEINMAYIGFGGSAALALQHMASEPEEFKRVRYGLKAPLTHFERLEMGPQSLAYFRHGADDFPKILGDKKISPQTALHFYGPRSVYDNVLSGARGRLTELLLEAIRRLRPST